MRGSSTSGGGGGLGERQGRTASFARVGRGAPGPRVWAEGCERAAGPLPACAWAKARRKKLAGLGEGCWALCGRELWLGHARGGRDGPTWVLLGQDALAGQSRGNVRADLAGSRQGGKIGSRPAGPHGCAVEGGKGWSPREKYFPLLI